jgi:hypothetical protein
MDLYTAIQLGPDDESGYRALAWLLATCPDKKVRQGRRAIDLATRACDLTEWKSWWALLPAALAMNRFLDPPI